MPQIGSQRQLIKAVVHILILTILLTKKIELLFGLKRKKKSQLQIQIKTK